MTDVADVLMLTLQVAVPLRIDEARRMTPRQREGVLHAWSVNAVDVVAGQGDQILFLSKPYKGQGGTANAFNHLARGLAALAFQPGGVRFGDVLWCGRHAPGGRVAGDERMCQRCCLYERLARAMRSQLRPDMEPPIGRSTRQRGIERVELPATDVTP